MRKKYDYFMNGELLSRKEFMEEIKKCCYKVVHTEVINGWCGVDFAEPDEKKFNRNMRDINKGIIVMFPHSNKTFRRMEAK